MGNDFGDEFKDTLLSNRLNAVPLSDFNNCLQLQGKEKLELNENEFILNSNVDFMEQFLNNALKNSSELKTDNKTYKLKQSEITTYNIETTGAGTDTGTVILPDSAFEGTKESRKLLNINTKKSEAEQILTDELSQINTKTEKDYPYFSFNSQTEIKDAAVGAKVLVVYLSRIHI